MQTPQAALARVIGAIGEKDFPAVAADAVLDLAGFDLGAVLLHGRAPRPVLMFDNFEAAGGAQGIANYVSVTHRSNPFVRAVEGMGVFRASDFLIANPRIGADLQAYLLPSPDEELGFRTVGWPERLEEIGLYFEACGGVVELSLYRERARRAAPARKLDHLRAMCQPLAAAFERHARLSAAVSHETPAALSPREAEVMRLLLAGCGSEAVALRLDISRHTVKDHRKRIFRKLGIGSLAELFALQRRP
jgi:DNA-binding CsgD family transcriptional regulator